MENHDFYPDFFVFFNRLFGGHLLFFNFDARLMLPVRQNK